MSVDSRNPETIVLHAGYRADPATGAVAVPIYQTTSYQFASAEHASNLFALKELGNIYTRIMNPTTDVLEKRVAALDGGVAALAVASGQAASALAVQNLAHVGDNIVSSTDLYGGTWNLFANTMKSMGIECRFVDPADPENFRRATYAKTRCYYAETLPNPKLVVFPVGEVAKIGRELGVPLIMDNTAAPVLCRPFDHGAAIVLHSTTKYIGGHGTSIGGILVDGGNFDWEAHKDRFPMLNTPDPSYHGAVWTQAVKPLGPIAYILKARVTLLRDLIDAFKQDVVKKRYATFDDLMDYASRSANPVGRLLLHLYGVGGAAALARSDAICSALQLANFWQDLGRDTQRGRLYLPETDCRRHGVDPLDLLAGNDSAAVHRLVVDVVAWARELMLFGAPLVHAVPGRAGWELRLVVQGGLRVLERIDQLGGATLSQRPKLGGSDAPTLLWRALRMRREKVAPTERAA